MTSRAALDLIERWNRHLDAEAEWIDEMLHAKLSDDDLDTIRAAMARHPLVRVTEELRDLISRERLGGTIHRENRPMTSSVAHQRVTSPHREPPRGKHWS